MLFDCAKHSGIFADDLGGGGDVPTVKSIIRLSKTALAGKQIELCLNALAVLLGTEFHVDRLDGGPSLDIFRQHIIGQIIRVKNRLPVQILLCGRLDHHPLFPKHKLIDVAVKSNINALHAVDGVRIDRNSERDRVIEVVGDIRPVNGKLPLVASSMDHGRHPLKSLHGGQLYLSIYVLVAVCIQPVFNVVLPVYFSVDLQIAVIVPVYVDDAVKGTFSNNSILP